MIQRLVVNGQDKDVWRKVSDDRQSPSRRYYSHFGKYFYGHETTETYLNRETTTSDNHTAVLKADVSDSKEILVLKSVLRGGNRDMLQPSEKPR